MKPISFKINSNTLEKMKKFYDSQMVPIDSTEYILKAHAIGCDVAVNTDLIASFDGQNAVAEASHWNKKIANKIEHDKNSDSFCLRHHIGAAETGSADYLGPLCIVACYLPEENIDFIKNLNIENVDELTNKQIIEYAKLIKGKVISSLLVLDNSHYNKMIGQGLNQANIRARLINQSIVNVLQKAKQSVEFKVIEQFVSPKTYFNYLKNEVIVVKDLMFEENADQQYMAVLAAKIISQYAYLQYFASMSKSLKMPLERGVSANVDQIAVAISKKYGEKMLNKVVKINFPNTKRVKNLLK